MMCMKRMPPELILTYADKLLAETGGRPAYELPRPTQFEARVADTAGVGDTHIAEMCAGLLLDYDLETACLMANAGAALAISHESALPVPTREQVENVLETGVVTNILR